MTDRPASEFRNRVENDWADSYPQILEAGYMLRPRYSPAWIPSWTKSYWKRQKDCEDGQETCKGAKGSLLDAVRVIDGTPVMLKECELHLHPYEADIIRFFSSGDVASDPRNHCVPVYDVVPVSPEGVPAVLIVTPLLRQYNDPPFETVGQVVDFFTQIFEGLQFMHAHNVAHRDCTGANIMMDPSELFPEGFHPIRINKARDFRGPAIRRRRSQCSPRYLFIDFGISRHYKPEERPPLEGIIRGADKSPPEHQGQLLACDPFPTDVYYLGNFVHRQFVELYSNLGFIANLSVSMTQDDPTKRPTMDQVVESFADIWKRLSEAELNARLVKRSERAFESVVKDLIHFLRHVFGRIGFRT